MAELVIEAASYGNVRRVGAESYVAAHDAAEATEAENTSIGCGQYRDSYLGGWNDNTRGGVGFSLAGLPSNAAITTATLSLYISDDSSDTDFNITVVSGADLAATMVLADWGDLLDDIISYGALTTVGLVLGAYNIITLNATGIAAIQDAIASGVIRFGIRSSLDISATEPTGDPEYQSISASGAAEGKKPKLTITYTVPFIPKIFYF